MTFREILNKNLNEGSPYPIYHNSYTSAIQAAEQYAEKLGYELDKEEMGDKIGLGPAKPKEGKTNSISLTLKKGGKEQKKMLHIQVYNRGTTSNEYELNAYIM